MAEGNSHIPKVEVEVIVRLVPAHDPQAREIVRDVILTEAAIKFEEVHGNEGHTMSIYCGGRPSEGFRFSGATLGSKPS